MAAAPMAAGRSSADLSATAAAGAPPRVSPATAAAIALVQAYQVALAPFSGGACRFTPSCSAYALDAIRLHGAARGLWLAARRVARCHPWGGFGHDPVPAVAAGPLVPAPGEAVPAGQVMADAARVEDARLRRRSHAS